MNVEIGNPAYKIYEGDPDDDAGELLDSDFALDPDKVLELKAKKEKKSVHPNYRNTYFYFLLWVFSRAVLLRDSNLTKWCHFSSRNLLRSNLLNVLWPRIFLSFFFFTAVVAKKC